MNQRIKISVWGPTGPLNILRDSLNKCLTAINFFEVVDSYYKQPDIIYWVGGKGPSIKKYFLFWIKKNPLIINHWIGTDVLEEMKKINALHRREYRILFWIA